MPMRSTRSRAATSQARGRGFGARDYGARVGFNSVVAVGSPAAFARYEALAVTLDAMLSLGCPLRLITVKAIRLDGATICAQAYRRNTHPRYFRCVFIRLTNLFTPAFWYFTAS